MDALKRSIAMAELSIALLLEAHDRLEDLCGKVEDGKLGQQCGETIKHIAAQVGNLRQELTFLKTWLAERGQ